MASLFHRIGRLRAAVGTWGERSRRGWSGPTRKPLAARRPALEPLEERALLSAGGSGDFAGSYLPPRIDLSQPGGYLTGPASGAALDIAMAYLTSHADQVGLSPSDILHSVVTDQYSDTDSGMTHIYLRQELNGIPVVNANMNVNVAADGRILSVGGGFVAGLSLLENTSAVACQPALSAVETLGRSVGDLGLTPPSVPISVVAASSDLLQSTTLASSDLSLDPIPAKLQYVATASGIQLTWDYVLRTPDGQHWYELNASSSTGTALAASDWIDHASYTVFARPTENPDDGSRTMLTDPNDPVASPYGWHDTNGVSGAEYTDTRGNNVSAQDDWNADDTGGARPDGGTALNFNFPLDLSQDPHNYVNAAVTNLFYWNNLIHDIHYVYGFNEVAGNFQQTNYSGLGLGGDPVQADAQDGEWMDNANFGTPPDGTSPRMQMFEWDATVPDRDGDLESVIMVHEAGHGVSNRLVGGPSNVNALDALQSGGMGEGWSDFWGLMFTQKATDTKMASYPVGNYVLGYPPNGPGIRTYPYSFNMAVNPHTYGDYNYWPEVHYSGEIWCSALWDLNWLLIDKYGFNADLAAGYTGPGSAGNILELKLVMDSLKLMRANPTFLDGRDAVLQADVALTGGANQKAIWTAFARRGMGLSAYDGGDANSLTVVEAFDVPNQAPVLTPTVMTLRPVQQGDTTNFGTRVAVILSSGGTDPISDPDDDTTVGIAVIAANNNHGSWQYTTDNGVHWLAMGSPSNSAARLLAAEGGTRVRFVPNSGYHGKVSPGITFRAWDESSGKNGGVATITATGGKTAFSIASASASVTVITANTAPVLDTSVALSLAPIEEDDPSNTGTLIDSMLKPANQYVITDADNDPLGIAVVEANNADGSWQYLLAGTTHWTPVGSPTVSHALLLTANDRIRFVPAAENFNGTVSPGIQFRAWDQTAFDSGDVTSAEVAGGTSPFSTNIGSASITVLSVNDAPVLADTSAIHLAAIREDVDDLANVGTRINSILSGHRITDVDAGAQQGIAVIAADNTDGLWEFSLDNGVVWAPIDLEQAYQALLLASHSSNRIRFVPEPDFNGLVDPGITFLAWDRSAGTSGQVVDVPQHGGATAFSEASATIGISVTPVNDPPTFVKGSNQELLEDTDPPEQELLGWITEFYPGPDDESGQAIDFRLHPDHPEFFSAGPAIDADGTLTYTPAPDAFGTAIVTVWAHDTGGIANGGRDLSDPQTFTITILPVNDPPSFFPGANVTVAEDAGAQALAWATHISAGAANEAGQQLTFVLDCSNTALFSQQPAIGPNGTLTFTPAPNANGSAEVTVYLQDNGGTDNGGSDVSPEQMFTITVTPVNDRPHVLGQQITLDANQSFPLASLSDDGDPEVKQVLSYTIVSGPAHGTITPDPVTGDPVYHPTPGSWGPDQFTFTVTDDNQAGLPWSLTSLPATVHVSVNPVVNVSANANLVLRKSGSNLQLTGTSFTGLLSAVPKLTILASAGAAVGLTVDFSVGGNFNLPNGVVFVGGSAAGGDVLTVKATSKGDTFLVEEGRVLVNGLAIAFQGVEQLKLDGQAGDDTYAIANLEVPIGIADKSGKDLLDFSQFQCPPGVTGIAVDLSLTTGQQQPAVAHKRTLKSLTGIIENVIGSGYDDVIAGNSAANLLRGGLGNDTIRGGGGNDILFGGDGNDVLTAGVGKSILIGGAGIDTLDGSLGENILIGGTTAYDSNNAANSAALMAILGEWTSSRKFSDRVTRLQAGIGTNHSISLRLNSTVFDDGVVDLFLGSAAKNWFLA